MTASAPPHTFAMTALILGLAGASAALGADRFVAPERGEKLESGDRVRLEWILSDAETPAFDEMEIVLSLDGGQTFPIRLTRNLSAGTRSLFFRVPALPSARGRLALRAGRDDEADAEEILLVSDELVIEAGPSSPIESTLSVRGEWRTREALDGGRSEPQPDLGSLGAAAPAYSRAPEAPDAAAPQPRPLADGSAPRGASTYESVAAAPAWPSSPGLSRMPADIPRRE